MQDLNILGVVNGLKGFWDAHSRKNRLLIIAGFMLLVFVIDYSYSTHKKKVRMDFDFHYLASSALIDGKNIYDKNVVGKKFKYFPVNAVLFLPFAVLNPYVASSLWFTMSLTMAFLIFKLGNGFYDGRLGKLWFLPIFFVWDIFWGNLKLGQMNLPVFFFTVLGLHFFLNSKDLKAGLTIGLASVLKFMPVVFIVYFAFKREWKVVKGALISIVFLLLVLPFFALGPKYFCTLSTTYLKEGSNRVNRMTGTKRAYGQSIDVLVFYLLSPVNRAPEKHKPFSINFLSLQEGTAQFVALLVCLSLFVLSFAIMSRGGKTGKYHWVWEFSIIFTLMLIISPEARKAHFLTLFIPFSSLVAYVNEHRQVFLPKLVLLFSYLLLLVRHRNFLVGDYSVYFVAYSSMGISALLLFFTLLFLYPRILDKPSFFGKTA